MKKFTLLALAIGLACGIAQAQQDPMFTKYMFNSLSFNPAYAGSNDHMTANIIHRSQWIGFGEGAPLTQSFIIHSPLKNERVGVGLSVINDKIGPIGNLDAYASYAYRIPIGKYRLAIGLQGGVSNWRANWSQLRIEETGDDAFQPVDPKWLPNFGTGVYFSGKKFYTGFGVPRMIEYDLRDASQSTSPVNAKQYRHYYATIGAAIPLGSENLVFKPSALVKSAGWFGSIRKDAYYKQIGAPNEFNVDISFFLQQALWIGTSFRSSIEKFDGNRSSYDSIDAWVAFYLKNGLRIGAAYDYPLTELKRVSAGSVEVMVGYEWDYKTKRVVTPRYF